MACQEPPICNSKKNGRSGLDAEGVEDKPLKEQVISGIVALVKETGWKLDYILWEMPCAWLFLLIDFWPTYKKETTDEAEVKEVSALSDEQLQQLGLNYAR